MSRPPHQLCLDRAHCPLAKTRAFIRTDDPGKPHVCPLAKPECVRELCDIPRAKAGLGPWVLMLLILLVSASSLAWQQGWPPKEWAAELHHAMAAVVPATAQPAPPAVELVALQKQKQEAEAAVAALQKEREKDQAARLKAEEGAANARAEVAQIKQAAPGQASAPPSPPAPKSTPPAGTVSDDLAKFFPGTQPKP